MSDAGYTKQTLGRVRDLRAAEMPAETKLWAICADDAWGLSFGVNSRSVRSSSTSSAPRRGWSSNSMAIAMLTVVSMTSGERYG